MAAAAFDRLAVLRELLERGADVHARCDQVHRRLLNVLLDNVD